MKTCCFCCSLRNGTITIAILQMVSSLISFITFTSTSTANDPDNSDDNANPGPATKIVLIITAFASFIMGGLLLFGAIKKITKLFIPWFVSQGIIIVISGIICVIFTILTFPVGLLFSLFILIPVCLNVYFTFAVHCYYKELKNEELLGLGNTTRQECPN